MIKKHIQPDRANVLIMGLAFKENCPDIRNTRVIDIINELQDYNVNVSVYDPWVEQVDAEHEYGIELLGAPVQDHYDGIVLAVGHEQFREMGIEKIRALGRIDHVLYDLKYLFSAAEVDLRL